MIKSTPVTVQAFIWYFENQYNSIVIHLYIDVIAHLICQFIVSLQNISQEESIRQSETERSFSALPRQLLITSHTLFIRPDID